MEDINTVLANASDVARRAKDHAEDPNNSNERSKRGKQTEERMVNEMNTSTGMGNRVKRDIEKMEGKLFKSARKIGGSNRHDIEITFTDDSTKTIELKTTLNFIDLANLVSPLQVIPQYLQVNKGFKIRERYIKVWYDDNISSGYLRKIFEIPVDIPTPTFDEWVQKDARQGGPKTPFSIKLKQLFKASSRLDKIMKKIKGTFVDKFRRDIMGDPNFESIMTQIFDDWKTQTTQSLNNKDYWLVVPLYESWTNYKLFKKIQFPKDINRDNLTIGGKADFEVKVNHPLFNSIRIRWQNRVGVANVSVQCS